MRLAHRSLLRRALLALAATFLLTGCPDSSTPPKKVDVTPVDPATAGVISVEVDYTGAAPAPQEINMRTAAQCAAAHPSPVYDQSLAVAGGKLANAVVWIKDGFGDRAFATPEKPVEIDQIGCMYSPHVSAAMVGQPVEFVNSDPEPHNVHGQPKTVKSWNFIMSVKNSKRTLTFDKPEVAVPVGCDIHPWMRAYLAVVDNPYFAVTPANGSATLSNVPPGDYTVAVWHEKLGTKEQKVTLPPSGKVTVKFEYAG